MCVTVLKGTFGKKSWGGNAVYFIDSYAKPTKL